jgi:hypothetical protein
MGLEWRFSSPEAQPNFEGSLLTVRVWPVDAIGSGP